MVSSQSGDSKRTRRAWLSTNLAGALIVCLVSVAGGCQRVPGRSLSPQATPDGLVVPMRVLYESPNGGVHRPLRTVVDTPEEFERLWREVQAGATPTPSLPPVDFTHEMVIVASMGFQASVGGKIAITGVHDRSNVLEVMVDISPFPVGCDGYPEVTYPVVMVSIPSSHSTVVFQDRVIQTQC